MFLEFDIQMVAFPVNFNGHNTRTFGDTNKLVYFTMHIVDRVRAVKKFLPAMGYQLKENVLLEDNTSSILMKTNGRSWLGERNRAIDVRYFVIKDVVDKGEVKIQHCLTQDMRTDFFTKPLQDIFQI